MYFDSEFVHFSLLYMGNDAVQYTFRMEIRMKDDIDRDTLRYAVDCTMKRYPYFAIKVVENGAELDTVFNGLPVVISEGNTSPCLCTDAANYHFLAFAFVGKRLFIDVHHGLTDGTGMDSLAKTLLYYYVTNKYSADIDPSGINTLETPISPEEYNDPYAKITEIPDKPLSVYAAEPAFDLGSVNKVTETKRVYYFKVSEADMMKLAKSNDGTPNATLSAMLYKAISKHHPSVDAPIVGGIAMSTRKALGSEKNNASLVSVTHIKYGKNAKDFSLEKLGTLGRGSLILQSDDQNILAGLAGRRQLINYLKTVPDHNQRRIIYKGLVQKATNLDTYSISYVGKKDWVRFYDYVDAYYAIAECKKGGILLEISAFNGYFYLCFTQDIDTDKYIDTMVEYFNEYNIKYSFEGKEEISIPYQKVF